MISSLETRPTNSDLYEVTLQSGDVLQQIDELYQANAQMIVDALGSNPMAIVFSPWSNGKSSFLIPNIQKILRAQGINTKLVSDPAFSYSDLVDELDISASLGVLLLDEAGGIKDNEMKKRILSIARDRRRAVVPVIPYILSDEATWFELAVAWREAEKSISGFEAQVIKLEPTRLSPPLAKKFFSTLQQKRNITLPEEVLTFLLAKVPGHLKLLNLVSQIQVSSIEEAARILLKNLPNWEKYYLTKEESLSLKQALEEELHL